MTFDMNRTWNHAMALLSANWQLLAIIAGVFMLLPAALMYVVLPDMAALSNLGPNPDPDRVWAMLSALAVPLTISIVLIMVAQTIGYLAMIALIGDDRPTVGEALRRGLAYLPAAIGTSLVLGLGYFVVVLVLALVFGIIVAGITALAGEIAGAMIAFVGAVAILVGVVFIATRFILTTPIIALEGITNPLAVIQRSWALTKSHAMKIFLFFMLIFVAYFVISFMLGMVFGGVAALLGPGTASSLVLGLMNGIVGAVVAMIFSAIMVAIHRELTGVGNQTIDQTFG